MLGQVVIVPISGHHGHLPLPAVIAIIAVCAVALGVMTWFLAAALISDHRERRR